VTVVGDAGIGKSRLVSELVAELGDDATVAIGRCQSYGEGAAHRPLAEIVEQVSGGDPRQGVEELLDGDEPVTRLVLGAIGLSESAAQAEETHWAVRRLLERVASERPLVVVVEDVHWAEPTLLDLLDYLVAFSSGHAIVVVAIARPEFAQTRPGWMNPQPGRSVTVLEALSEGEARELVESTGAGSGAAARIVDTAEGNPFFLEQLVAVGAESGAAALPSTIQAVLAARIDRLEPGERAVLELASVQGRNFYVEALIELLDDHDVARTATHLVSLVQQQLIRSDRSDLAGQDAFRFAHALIREAAYHALPKQRRADLHERVARWLERSPGAQDETIGHHLGEAYRLLADLGPVGERERALAAGAVERLDAAAGAALHRGDAPAGARLLERAAALMSHDDPGRNALLPRLGAALLEAGRLAEADEVLTEAIERARDDSLLEARARVERQLVRLQGGSTAPIAEVNEIADAALEVFEAHGDEHGQCRALWLRALHALVEGRLASADEDWQRAAEHARRADDELALFEILGWRASAALFGPTPVPEGIARCREIQEQVRSSSVAVAHTCRPLAALQAMAGELEDADRLVRASDEILEQLGGLHTAASQEPAMVDLLAGRPDAAEARLRRGYEALAEMGEKALLATTAAMLAQTLYAQGRHEEAGELCEVGEQAAAEEDVAAQVGWRSVRAKLRARAGRSDEAEALAAEAVRRAERTDFLTLRAEAQLDLAEVLGAGGRSDEAEAARQAALELYRQKGDVVSGGAIAR
jgi:predicted ATPase